MSSTIEYYDCPICGSSASREQDTATCEVCCWCSNPDCPYPEDEGERLDMTELRTCLHCGEQKPIPYFLNTDSESTCQRHWCTTCIEEGKSRPVDEQPTHAEIFKALSTKEKYSYMKALFRH